MIEYCARRQSRGSSGGGQDILAASAKRGSTTGGAGSKVVVPPVALTRLEMTEMIKTSARKLALKETQKRGARGSYRLANSVALNNSKQANGMGEPLNSTNSRKRDSNRMHGL